VKNNIVVSVITTTFQHPPLILYRAINSVRIQKGVEYEHIIIDDTHTKNGMMKTYQKAFNRCSGDYIAFCDGDDYWCSEDKLKRQVDYMNSNPGCGLCITKVYGKRGDDLKEMPSANYVNSNMSFDALLKGTAYIHAQSYLLRKSDFDKYIDFDFFVNHFNTWDYPIVLELIQYAKIHCLEFYSAVNVINEESVTHTRNRVKRLKYILGTYKIKWYYIKKYGCKLSTAFYLIYRAVRHIYSIGGKRWT